VADNSSRLDALGASETIASDDISGVKYQRVKLTVGADGTAADVLPPADALAGSGMVAAGAMVYNGSTWDRARSNLDSILLASAARTVTTGPGTQTNYNHRGAIFILDVTSAGTGTLQIQVNGFSNVEFVVAWSTTVTTNHYFMIYPGVLDADYTGEAKSVVLPRTWTVYVAKSDASSWTYSLGHCLIV
jgi:hypothetical protein